MHNMHLAGGDVHLWWLFPEDVKPLHPLKLACLCAVMSWLTDRRHDQQQV